jgi:hypothetical protein
MLVTVNSSVPTRGWQGNAATICSPNIVHSVLTKVTLGGPENHAI